MRELPREDTYLYHLRHVTLRPCVVGLVLHSHQHDEVQVVPHVVLVFNVLLKGHCLVVELVPFESWERQARAETVEGGHGEGRRREEVSEQTNAKGSRANCILSQV